MTRGAAGLTRRMFLGLGLPLALLGFGRRLRALGTQVLRYRPLARPVLIPLAEVSVPWRARRFVAEAVSPASATEPNRPVRINGMLVRTSAGDDAPDRFKAIAAVCPHEQCEVDFIADPSQLPAELLREIGSVREPVYVCPCHNSTFTAAHGERLGGPAPRGLYRFRVTGVTSAAVEIGEVEEDAVIFI